MAVCVRGQPAGFVLGLPALPAPTSPRHRPGRRAVILWSVARGQPVSFFQWPLPGDLNVPSLECFSLLHVEPLSHKNKKIKALKK